MGVQTDAIPRLIQYRLAECKHGVWSTSFAKASKDSGGCHVLINDIGEGEEEKRHAAETRCLVLHSSARRGLFALADEVHARF